MYLEYKSKQFCRKTGLCVPSVTQVSSRVSVRLRLMPRVSGVSSPATRTVHTGAPDLAGLKHQAGLIKGPDPGDFLRAHQVEVA